MKCLVLIVVLMMLLAVGAEKCLTWFEGFFQAVVVRPVLGVPLLQPAENFCCLVQTLQLQQQLSWKQKAHHIKSKSERVRGEVRRSCRLAIPPPHLVSPPPPACRRSASRSWTGAPGPPCTDLPPSAPGSGRAAARCTRNPLCQETSEWTERQKNVSFMSMCPLVMVGCVILNAQRQEAVCFDQKGATQRGLWAF